MNTVRIQDQPHQVESVTEICNVEPQLAQLMRARGFDAYGYVKADGRDAIAYRRAGSNVWQLVARVR